jgi:hypothetical protein
MDGYDILLLVLFIGIPVILAIAAIAILRSEKFHSRYNQTIEITFLGKSFLTKKYTLIILGFLSLVFGWLNLFLPSFISLAITLVGLSSFQILSVKTFDPEKMPETTRTLVAKLSSIESDIEQVRQHISILQIDLNETQKEVNEKERLKEYLKGEVRKKKESAEAWAQMTQTQKDMVAQAAVTAISRKMKGQFWYGLILGFFINILAALVWSLIGNPSKADIVTRIKALVSSLFN